MSLPGLALVVAIHIALLAVLASLGISPLALPANALMVQILDTQPTAAPAPLPQPARQRPEPVRQKIAPATPMIAAPSAAAESVAAPAPTPNTAVAAAPVSAAVSQPRFDADYLSNPAPVYPSLSRRMGEDGKVVLRVLVDPDGRPTQIEIRSSSDSPRLDRAAQDAVWRWKFIPARRGDEAVSAWVLVPIVFNLKN